MKKTILNPTVFTALSVFLIGLCINLSINTNTHQYKWAALAGAIILQTIIAGVIGGLFLLHKDLRPVAQGIFIGLGLNLVIGFSICTML